MTATQVMDDRRAPRAGGVQITIGGTPRAALEAGRLRLRTLVALRWLAVFGQTVAVLMVAFGLGYPLPLAACLSVVGASVLVNLFSLRLPVRQRLEDRHAALFLAFDILQLFLLLMLTGGLQNPFSVLFLGPVTIAATALPLRYVLILAALGLVCMSTLGFVHLPLPWRSGEALQLPRLYIGGIWGALVIGYGFITAYAWRVAQESRRMSAALAASQVVLAREQRMAALGGLAAAAAHELGTPLATITLVAKELAREWPEGTAHHEDVALIREQAQRCREILRRLSQEQNAEDAIHARVGIKALLEEVAEPHRGFGVVIETRVVAKDGQSFPELWRKPEIVHGLGNFVENAVDFARQTVLLEGALREGRIEIRIVDDGPGIAPDVVHRLGEPYVTTRPRRLDSPGPDSARPLDGDDDPEGMGLGFFIASTLLERTGARISAENTSVQGGELGGAAVTVSWPRAVVEAPTPEKAVPAAEKTI